ncbi:uncharacterized protein LOC121879127 isoform X2 [Homarus americanus]|uniref:uncharacterized protein LOC121879127 isoform X2 n=1 Tax=Homarus americanus TaxID=6706 RepID=UPI001C44EA2C|nr:uncharacterized protein LOC121879127 isoform X2 [Homarus americanus]
METTKVLTSLLVLTLTGPTLGYPYTRGVVSRTSGRSRDQFLDGGLGDYLMGYTDDEQYALPQYEPNKRYAFAAQRPRINPETLAAFLPILADANNDDDYVYDYNTYSDDDGTWYENTANGETVEDNLLPVLLQRRTSRYSMDDLETLERKAAMEDNTENQLYALMANKQQNLKRTSIPLLGSRVAVPPRLLRKGQKEEAYDIPATSVRRPVFARTVTTQPEEQTETQSINKNDNNSNTQKPEETKKDSSDSSSTTTTTTTNHNNVLSSSSSNINEVLPPVETATMSPYISERHEAFKNYLDTERKVRQLQDIEMELLEQRRAPQKRFVAEKQSLPQQLVSLKKVA